MSLCSWMILSWMALRVMILITPLTMHQHPLTLTTKFCPVLIRFVLAIAIFLEGWAIIFVGLTLFAPFPRLALNAAIQMIPARAALLSFLL